MKYLCSYAVAGCLSAIALSAFITEITRLLPEIIPAALILWGVIAVVSGVALKVANMDKVFGSAWVWGNVLIALGVGLGLA